MNMPKSMPSYTFDAVIVGAGGAGMRAALNLAESGAKVALVSKVFPTRSHTVSAQGGITCALGNAHEDDWRWHWYDTVKGSDFLGDQDSIEYMCKTGPEVVYELEHMGMPFSRLEDGRIYQRPFGGQSKNFGGEQGSRTCAVADRTGHALLHTLYQQNVKFGTQFFNEWYALDIVKGVDGKVSGVVAQSMETGEKAFMHTRALVFATGGAGRIFQSTTNAHINTGDGVGMMLRAGFPVQDMEMWQFHPTGIAGAGCLITEGVRGEGGYLINANGERFMERYAPNAKDLASRDVVSRAMSIEISEGRGFTQRGVGCVKLKLDHLGEDIIKSHLPGIRELAMTFAHVDPIKEPIPVVPTCHYMMGGIPTNVHGEVLSVNEAGEADIIPGLYAVGECACVSVHGANRMGGNSLLDLIVFGRATSLHLEKAVRYLPLNPVTRDHIDEALVRYNRWETNTDGESVDSLRAALQLVMQEDFGVFRTEERMVSGLEKIKAIGERLQKASISDHSDTFNTARIEALELDNLYEISLATAISAIDRKESRGAHCREDYPQRDDENWLKHVVYFSDETLAYRKVNFDPKFIEAMAPKERVY